MAVTTETNEGNGMKEKRSIQKKSRCKTKKIRTKGKLKK